MDIDRMVKSMFVVNLVLIVAVIVFSGWVIVRILQHFGVL